MFEPLQGRWHISCWGSLPHDDLHLLLITVQQHTLIYSRRLPLQDKWCRWDVFWLKTPAVSNSFPQTDKPSSYLPDPDLNFQIDPFFPPTPRCIRFVIVYLHYRISTVPFLIGSMIWMCERSVGCSAPVADLQDAVCSSCYPQWRGQCCSLLPSNDSPERREVQLLYWAPNFKSYSNNLENSMGSSIKKTGIWVHANTEISRNRKRDELINKDKSE